jgi:hypothetical protein
MAAVIANAVCLSQFIVFLPLKVRPAAPVLSGSASARARIGPANAVEKILSFPQPR